MDCRRFVASMFAATALLAACGDDGEGTTASTSGTTEATATSTATATDSDTATTDASSSTTDDSTTGVPNMCDVNAIGEWNACKKGALTDNSLCNWMDNGESKGEIRCLLPAGGGGSLCSIEACESECDCFVPPATGTAIVQCAPVLGDGTKACVLNCAGDVTCPDGMECISGYCYLPN